MPERQVVQATVQGKTLVLDEPLLLPDGTLVTITVVPQEEEMERERKFYAQLATEGLITLPKPSLESIRHNPPRKVAGKPLSQIIIEER